MNKRIAALIKKRGRKIHLRNPDSYPGPIRRCNVNVISLNLGPYKNYHYSHRLSHVTCKKCLTLVAKHGRIKPKKYYK